MSASIVAHGDTAAVLDPTEHVFDFVALAIERGIVGVLHFTVLAWRDTWIDAFADQGGAEPHATAENTARSAAFGSASTKTNRPWQAPPAISRIIPNRVDARILMGPDRKLARDIRVNPDQIFRHHLK